MRQQSVTEKSQVSQVRKGDRAEARRDRLEIKRSNRSFSPSTDMAYTGKYTAPATFHRLLHRLLPKDKYRILIIGRANAGKISILQKMTGTTNSPAIYRENKKVRDLPF
jgi:hypothetical protein